MKFSAPVYLGEISIGEALGKFLENLINASPSVAAVVVAWVALTLLAFFKLLKNYGLGALIMGLACFCFTGGVPGPLTYFWVRGMYLCKNCKTRKRQMIQKICHECGCRT